MIFSRIPLSRRAFLPLALGLLAPGVPADAPLPVGFAPPEIYLADFGTRALRTGDFNGDGRPDLLLINNERGRLDLYLQLDPESGEPPPAAVLHRDRWQPVLSDGRFQRQSLIIGTNMLDLVTGDFNGDGHEDFAFTDDQNRLHIYHGPLQPGWQPFVRLDVSATQNAPGTLAWDETEKALLLLGEREIQEVRWQTEDNRYQVETASSVPPGSRPHLLSLMDINGNGRRDVVYQLRATGYNLAVHHRRETGLDDVLLPLIEPPAEQFTPFGDQRLLGLHPRSGALQQIHLEAHNPEFNPVTSESLDVRYLNFPGPAREIQALWADLNGDGAQDLITLSPGRPELFRYVVKASGAGHAPPVQQPIPAGMNWMAAGRWLPGDGAQQLLLHDTDTRYLGVAGIDGNRIAFPRQIDNQTEIIAASPLPDPLDDGGRDRLLAITRENRAYHVNVYRIVPGEEDAIALENRQSLELPFVNRDVYAPLRIDGNMYLVCSAFDSGFFLLQNEDGELEVREATEGFSQSLLRRKKPEDFLILPPGSPFPSRWVLTQDGTAQFLTADANGTVRVLDQYNLNGSGRLRGILPFDPEGRLIGLFDAGRNLIELHRRDENGRLSYLRDLKLPPMQVQDVQLHTHRDGEPELRVQGREQIAFIRPHAPPLTARVETLYETDLRETRHHRLVTGDFNGDGQADIALIDPAQTHVMEFLARRDEVWQPVMHFQIFDASISVAGRRGGSIEPREAHVTDINGNGRDDLLLLIHDRILVYIQDDLIPSEN